MLKALPRTLAGNLCCLFPAMRIFSTRTGQSRNPCADSLGGPTTCLPLPCVLPHWESCPAPDPAGQLLPAETKKMPALRMTLCLLL